MKKILIIIGALLILCSCGNDNNRYELIMKGDDYIVFDTATGKTYILDISTKTRLEIDIINGEVIEKEKVMPVFLKNKK
jgi:hypothetical protein